MDLLPPVDEGDALLKIGRVSIRSMLGDVRDLEVDALVQPSGTSPQGHAMQASPWVIEADRDGSIFKALRAHHPFKLGEVIVTSAGSLKAKYLFSAVVIDWGHQGTDDRLLCSKIVTSTARRCIEIAAALRIKSIAFTPWGTRVGTIEAPQVTALLVQAIASALQEATEALESVYLISNNEEHYKWFVDRAFMFTVMFGQILQIRDEIDKLGLSRTVNERIEGLLGNLQHNLSSTVNIFLDQSKNIATGGGAFVQGSVRAGGTFAGRDNSRE